MVFERRVERVVEQVLDGEGLREVGAGCLAGPRSVVEVNVACVDDDVAMSSGCRDEVPLGVESEVVRGNRQARLEQALVDRAELANRQAPEINWPNDAVRTDVYQERGRAGPNAASDSESVAIAAPAGLTCGSSLNRPPS